MGPHNRIGVVQRLELQERVAAPGLERDVARRPDVLLHDAVRVEVGAEALDEGLLERQ